MKNVDYMEVAERAMAGIRRGAFLTVRSDETMNTMAIGWGTIGFLWRKPVLMVAVRPSRHTFTLLKKAQDFTVSVPSSEMAEEIAFCGTKSGRDFDKFKECGLAVTKGREVASPIIQVPGLHFECRIVYASAMDAGRLDQDYDSRIYPDGDYHTLFFGEIVTCYETK